jgi:hypothetical protein
MIHRTARERLLFEAREAAEDVERLDGIRGHTVTLERSAHGPARIVRVWHDGAVVSWSFSLEPGEARPAFYPNDVPQISDAHCEMTWDNESGLVVKWREQLDPQRQAQFRQNLKSFSERVEAMNAKMMTPDSDLTREQRTEALMAMASPGLEDDVASRIGDIIAFHEAAGWSLESRPGPGPVVKARLKRGDTERSMVATTVGAAVIVLAEEGPDSRGSRNDGPTAPRVGLRLTME